MDNTLNPWRCKRNLWRYMEKIPKYFLFGPLVLWVDFSSKFRHANPRKKISSPPFSLDVPPFFTILRRSLLIFHHSSLMLHHTPSFALDVPPFSLDAPPFSLDVEAARFLDLFATCLSHNSTHFNRKIICPGISSLHCGVEIWS
ncbi:hypothetical protein DEO72_LG1g1910 [Vigna unguiculata]|uniref:Uncharacterized protein n=1 Tax=Vigna unguiculata TaxID=3917 RepID=A0A4D6KL74_VIGUN|nr:hypothetical protein DEO72_LG1g1910 [Vigna unguiculata]